RPVNDGACVTRRGASSRSARRSVRKNRSFRQKGPRCRWKKHRFTQTRCGCGGKRRRSNLRRLDSRRKNVRTSASRSRSLAGTGARSARTARRETEGRDSLGEGAHHVAEAKGGTSGRTGCSRGATGSATEG